MWLNYYEFVYDGVGNVHTWRKEMMEYVEQEEEL